MSLSYIPAWLQVIIAAGAVYAGIRADLATIREKAEQAAAAATRAHARIDTWIHQRRPQE